MKLTIARMECDAIGTTLDGAAHWILGNINVELYLQDDYLLPRHTIMTCTLREMIALLADPDSGYRP